MGIIDFDAFCVNAVTCASATVVTHPIELVKTRMQIQGELTREYTRTYSGTIQSTLLIIRNDGFLSLWSGLSAGLAYQIVMNGTRLTLFDMMKAKGTNVTAAGVGAGVIAGGIASPFYMLKTQQQALSSVQVGNQHSNSRVGIFRFFMDQIRNGGVGALYRGTSSQILRVAVGSGSQLTSFIYAKQFIRDIIPTSHWFVVTASSACVASVFVCLFMSPFDVVATRIYNQPLNKFGKGKLYSGPIDALIKIWKAEGVSAYLKGLRAGYPRHSLQTILTMSMWDIMKRQYMQLKNRKT